MRAISFRDYCVTAGATFTRDWLKTVSGVDRRVFLCARLATPGNGRCYQELARRGILVQAEDADLASTQGYGTEQ